MHTTSRLGLDVIDGTDLVSAYPAADAQAKGVLDNAAIFLSGAIVSRPAAGILGRYYFATDDTSSGSSIGTMYFDTGSAWVSGFNPPSRGATNIATSQSTSSAAYTTLATPDQVTGVVLPSNGLIAVWYQATWQESVATMARAAIFIGANQLKLSVQNIANPTLQEASTQNAGNAAIATPLGTTMTGLSGIGIGTTNYLGDVTTGQIVGTAATSVAGGQSGYGGPLYVAAAAGTYTVSVQFKTSSGSVTASNRKLWVQALSFA